MSGPDAASPAAATAAGATPTAAAAALQRWLGPGLAVAVPTAAVGAHALLYGRWIVDDAAITFAYARSLTGGDGPVLQPGVEPVEGYSNPAWLALLGLGRVLGLVDRGSWFGVPDYVAFPKLLALVLVAGVFAGGYAVAATCTRRPVPVTIVAGLVTAAVPSFVIWTTSGLENALLAFAVTGLAAVAARAVVADRLHTAGTAVSCGLLAALAALTRPDGLVYVAAYPLVVLLLLRRADLVAAVRAVALAVLVFAVPVGGYQVWRLTTFGEWVPNTAIAKSQGLPGADAWARPAELASAVGRPAALLAAGLVVAACVLPSASRRPLVALLVPLALAILAFCALKPDWMGELRFATPIWPLGALAVVLAGVLVVENLVGLGWPGRAVLAVGAVLVVWSGLVAGSTLSAAARSFRAEPTAPLCLVAQNTGWTFNSYAEILDSPEPTLLAPDIGGSALVSNLRLVDLVGLTDRRIARFWATADMAGLRDHVFDEVRPTFITVNAQWAQMTGLLADPRLAADYVEIATSPSGVTDRVRRDALGSGDEAALRARVPAAAAADAAARRSLRGSCGPVLVPRAG